MTDIDMDALRNEQLILLRYIMNSSILETTTDMQLTNNDITSCNTIGHLEQRTTKLLAYIQDCKAANQYDLVELARLRNLMGGKYHELRGDNTKHPIIDSIFSTIDLYLKDMY